MGRNPSVELRSVKEEPTPDADDRNLAAPHSSSERALRHAQK
jgi:hypothetical protein